MKIPMMTGCLALSLLTTTMSFAQGKSGANKFGWYGDYATAKAEAKKSGKPIFLVFRCEP